MTRNFTLGIISATPGALDALEQAKQSPAEFVERRHQRGDWGEISDEDKAANEEALLCGARLLSAYTLRSGVKLWVITEADRSSTTLLLPSEY